MTFTLDTSGYVQCLAPDQKPNESTGCRFWSDLTPFAQGYVEALFASLPVDLIAEWLEYVDPYRAPGFSDLSPEALAIILADCASVLDTIYSYADPELQRRSGAGFWNARQAGNWTARQWAPLTVSLGDDGKVRLAVAK